MADVSTIDRIYALNAPIGRFYMSSTLPQTPEAYYGGSFVLKDSGWRGGEIMYHNGSGTGGNKLYIQTATSGRTPTWKRLLPQWTAV